MLNSTFGFSPSHPRSPRLAVNRWVAPARVILPIASLLLVSSLSLGVGAQTDPAQIGQYARAAYEIEQMRQRDYAEAKRLLGGNVPGDVCRQKDIPQPVQDICNRFLNHSGEIIRKHGLTPAQFNEITRRRQADPALQQQIQSELMKIQKPGS